MTKLKYPSSGIYSSCKPHVTDSGEQLRSAADKSKSLDVPSDFGYRNYLMNDLYGILDGYHQEVESIGEKIKVTNPRFSELSENLEKKAKSISITTIKDRVRMVK